MEHLLTAVHPDYSTNATKELKFPTQQAKRNENEKMAVLAWHGQEKVTVEMQPKVTITDPEDAVVRITTTTVCGSDLHLYHNEVQGLNQGFIIGHEAVGIIDEVGPNVTKFKKGDRVVISAVIACGKCEYCRREQFSLCDNTNPLPDMERLYGHRTAALFGYGMVGGFAGLQAEFARVPIADVNLLKLPPDSEFPDEKAILLSDIACTGWHACEMGEVHPGDNVVVFGAGPVGQMATMWAKYRGAARVFVVDHFNYRLNRLAEHVPGIETLNFEGKDPVKEIQQAFKDTGGPDVCIDCVGFRFPTTLIHTIEQKLRFETDSPEVVNECIRAVKKGGRVSLIGDYFMYANHFALGPMMEKSITVRGGQLFAQKYWHHLKDLLASGRPFTNADFVIDCKVPLSRTPDIYRAMDKGELTKAAIYTQYASRQQGLWPGQGVKPLDELAAEGSSSAGGAAGVLGGVATSVTGAVRSGLERMGLNR